MHKLSIIVFCAAAANFMGRLDTNIVGIALPAIAGHYQVSAGVVSALMLYYLLALSVLPMPLGGLGDRFGFRSQLLIGYALFALSAVLCSFAEPLWLLIAARGLQGAGAAMMFIAAYSIVSSQLPADKVGGAMGTLGAAGSIGVLVGAPLGGVLIEWLSWRAVFLVNLPIAALGFVLAWVFVPRDAPALTGRRQTDWIGILFGAGWVLLLVLGVDRLHGGETLRTAALLLSLSLLLFGLFLRHLRVSPQPLFSLALFGHGEYQRILGVQGFTFIAIAGHGFAQPFYLERVMALSHLHAGLVLALFPAGVALAAPLAGRLADRLGARGVLAAAALLNALATLLFTLALDAGEAWFVYPYLPLFGIGFGFLLAPAAKLLLAEMRLASQGAATSIFATINNLALTFGIALGALMLSARIAPGEGTAAFFPLYGLLTLCCLIAALLAIRNWLIVRRQALP